AYVTVAIEAEADPESPDALAPADVRALALESFHGGDCDVGFLERGPALLIFVPATREIAASNARTAATLLPKSVAKKKAQLRICGGMSRVESLLSLQAGVQSAEAALAIGRRVFGPGRVLAYEELGAYPMLYEGADAGRLQEFARA